MLKCCDKKEWESVMTFIPVFKPILPKCQQLIPYIQQIDQNRYYSNLGPLTVKFEQRLADHFGVHPENLLTSANGTLALTQILNGLGVKKNSLCVMPSWTFIATPASACTAGLIPFFVDVDPTSWTITPEIVEKSAPLKEIGAVIVVAPFGSPVDMKQWETFREKTGIPVIIDAAASFDSFSADQREFDITLPVMISLHATKVFGVGEGAVVLTNGQDLAKRIRMFGNFGFHNSREAMLPGMNAKLNEYMSAVGLAGLESWEETRKRWADLSSLFEKKVQSIPALSLAPNFNQGWVSSFGNIRLAQPHNALKIKSLMEKLGIGTVSWWGTGCHRHKAYKDYPQSDLTATEYLADHVLGLPFWLGLKGSDYKTIFTSLEKALGQQNG